MNPKTTLSKNDIHNICAANAIQFSSAKRITMGFTNEIHLINNCVILKVCVRDENETNMRIEAAMLKSPVAFSKPRFIAKDFTRQIISQPYLLMEYVAGDSLGSVWHTLDNTIRNHLIEKIANNLQMVNTIDPEELFESRPLWGDELLAKLDTDSRLLIDNGTVKQEQLDKVRVALTNYQTALNQSNMKTTFWDVHFDNFIVNKEADLLAIIDLESTSYAPLDYPIVTIENMMDSPIRFLSAEHEPLADKSDYQQLRAMYQQHYPAMFENEDLSKRLDIYHVLDAVHQLKDWPSSDWARNEFTVYSDKLIHGSL